MPFDWFLGKVMRHPSGNYSFMLEAKSDARCADRKSMKARESITVGLKWRFLDD
jgi:hypothetical protein